MLHISLRHLGKTESHHHTHKACRTGNHVFPSFCVDICSDHVGVGVSAEEDVEGERHEHDEGEGERPESRRRVVIDDWFRGLLLVVQLYFIRAKEENSL
jgi:hypothetical protein